MFLLQTPHEVVQTGKTYVCPHPGCDARFAIQAEFIAHRQLGQCGSNQPPASTGTQHSRPPLSPPDIQIIDSDDGDRRQGGRHQPPTVIDVVDVEDHRDSSSPEYLVEPSPDSSPAPPSSSPSPPPPSLRRPSQEEDTIEILEVEDAAAPLWPHGGARSAPPLFGAHPLLDARTDSLSDIVEEEPEEEEDITAVASCSRRETNGVERENGVGGPLRIRPLRNLLDPTFLPLHDVKEKKVFLDSPASPVANSIVFFDSPASPEAASVDPFAVPVNPATVPVQCITILDSPARLEPRSTQERERPANPHMSATLKTEIPCTSIPESPAFADVSSHLQQTEVPAVAHAAAAPFLQQPAVVAAILNSEKQAAVEAAPRSLPPVPVMVAAPSGSCSPAAQEVRGD
jgi:hypothetical protein